MSQIEKDISEIVQKKEYFDFLSGKTILITGATGLIGSTLIKCLAAYSKNNNCSIKIYANCRSRQKFEVIFNQLEYNNLIPVFSDIQEINLDGMDIDYVVHGASITESKAFIEKPVETIKIALGGTEHLFSQLAHKRIQGLVYLSSLEVYGFFHDFMGIKRVTEKEYGTIDCLALRSSYSEGKRMVENLCVAYASEYDLPVKIARLCQTFGAGVDYSDNRVFAQFARSVIEKNDIVLKTTGETVRNYCYITDAVTGILTLLAKGQAGEAYNIANLSTTISIYDMASICASMSGKSVILDLSDNPVKLGYNPVVKMELDPGKLQALGWTPLINDISDCFRRLITGMKETK